MFLVLQGQLDNRIIKHIPGTSESYNTATVAINNFKYNQWVHTRLSRFRPKHFYLRTLFAPDRHSPIYNLCTSS